MGFCVCVRTDKSQPCIPAFKSALQEFDSVLAELGGNSAWGKNWEPSPCLWFHSSWFLVKKPSWSPRILWMPHLGVLGAVSPVCDYHKTAREDLNRREFEPLIPLAGISAGFLEHMQNNWSVIAALCGVKGKCLDCKGWKSGVQPNSLTSFHASEERGRNGIQGWDLHQRKLLLDIAELTWVCPRKAFPPVCSTEGTSVRIPCVNTQGGAEWDCPELFLK